MITRRIFGPNASSGDSEKKKVEKYFFNFFRFFVNFD